MNHAFIITGVRTPVGNFGGSLATTRTDNMAGLVIKALMEKCPSIDPASIDDVLLGCANQAGEDNRNIARMALLLAGLPYSVPGETVNRLCASGLAASINGARAIQTGDAELIIAGGVENMTRGPWVISKTSAPFGRDAQMYDSSFGWRFINPKMQELYGTESMGETAENVAELYKIKREDQDIFAYHSQQKAARARETGRFKKESAAVEIRDKKSTPNPLKDTPLKVFTEDEFIKPATTIEILSTLKPAFRKGGSVTAGNSSGLNDGAAALLLASENAIRKYSLRPLAKVVSSAVVGVEPRIMGIGPVEASRKALKKANLTFNDIDIIELNEAFAAQTLACIRQWGLADDDPRINPNGGAIAIGHPLGMSGTRILLSAALELHEQKKRFALLTMCIGVGQGYAVVIEKT